MILQAKNKANQAKLGSEAKKFSYKARKKKKEKQKKKQSKKEFKENSFAPAISGSNTIKAIGGQKKKKKTWDVFKLSVIAAIKKATLFSIILNQR